MYPDRIHHELAGRKVGDNRWLAAPFLAHEYYGNTYRWMLFGDDDTTFFLTGVLRLLQRYNDSLPYWISDLIVDEYYKRGKARGTWDKPNYVIRSPIAATCLPCHFAKAVAKRRGGSALREQNITGCPCTRQQVTVCMTHSNCMMLKRIPMAVGAC